jgi:protein gp37
MNKSKIEWCTYTWSPVTGCLHGCEYCYARKIANRFDGNFAITNPTTGDFLISDFASECIVSPKLNDKSGAFMVQKQPIFNLKPENKTRLPYPFGFCPTFHRSRLNEPSLKTKPQTIFVCSMADLFGDWVPDEWIREVFDACKVVPWHNYLFLTKNPQRYCKLANAGKLPELDNFWYGSTITKAGECMFAESIHWNTFLSIEPLLEPLGVGIGSFGGAKWIIIGAETGNRAGKVKPESAWIENIIEAAKLTQAAVFMKDSLVPIVGEVNMRREFPW